MKVINRKRDDRRDTVWFTSSESHNSQDIPIIISSSAPGDSHPTVEVCSIEPYSSPDTVEFSNSELGTGHGTVDVSSSEPEDTA